mgnify:CR=1 FL=1
MPIKKANFKKLSPAQFTMLSFIGLSFIGALILMLPISNTNHHWRDFVSAFFMSVSSVCVTGLAVVDIGKEFSLFGQFVTLILMQVGGLSYMTMTTIFLYMLGKKISYSDSKIFDLSNNSDGKIDFTGFVIKIGLFTLIIETFGFIMMLYTSVEHNGLGKGIFAAIFHSVSAFCNAGLSLYTDSLCSFRDNYFYLAMFSLLPIIGGLGYTVLNELWIKFISKKYKNRHALSLHTRVSIKVTFTLLLVGIITQSLLIYFLGDLFTEFRSHFDNISLASFQSIASRSSGFNSIPLNDLGDASLIFLIAWMFIGACPGGTGGGIKVTTLAVVAVMMWSALRETGDTKLFNRAVPDIVKQRSVVVFISTVLGIMFATFLISVLEIGKSQRFIEQLFEVTSAFTTVGLSTGITGDLSNSSLIILCICMIIGRPGPLLFLMALIPEDSCKRIRYSEEAILIG